MGVGSISNVSHCFLVNKKKEMRRMEHWHRIRTIFQVDYDFVQVVRYFQGPTSGSRLEISITSKINIYLFIVDERYVYNSLSFFFFKPLPDMMAKDSKCGWGNYFSFIILPLSIGLQTDPLVCLNISKSTMARKKHSYHAALVYLVQNPPKSIRS